jgi:hypothetical protein
MSIGHRKRLWKHKTGDGDNNRTPALLGRPDNCAFFGDVTTAKTIDLLRTDGDHHQPGHAMPLSFPCANLLYDLQSV